MTDRELINGILGKLGVSAEEAEKLTDERANSKLVFRLKNNHFPTDLTDAEKTLLKSMGLPTEDAAPAGESGLYKEPAAKNAPKAKAAKKAAPTVTPKLNGPKGKASPKAKAAPKTPREPRGDTAVSVYRELMTVGKTRPKAEVIAKMVERSGCGLPTAAACVVWSKRPVSVGKIKNPFGFQVFEEKDDKGVKQLTRKK